MTSRVLAGAAGVWLFVYLMAYVWLVRDQQGNVAQWYVATGLLAAFAALAAAAGIAPLVTTTTALVVTAAATVAALLSTGLLLVPVLVALTVALLHGLSSRRPDRPEGRRPASRGTPR